MPMRCWNMPSRKKRFIVFNYRNGNGEKSRPCVEPLAIHYKWYAWYLFAYDAQRERYRTFKVARMQNLQLKDGISTKEHGDVKKLMEASEQEYYQTCIHIEVQFDKENTGLMEEYFPDCPPEELTETTSRIFIDVPAKERLWKALLLSFGDRVRAIGPETYRNELIETAQKFLSNYDI